MWSQCLLYCISLHVHALRCWCRLALQFSSSCCIGSGGGASHVKVIGAETLSLFALKISKRDGRRKIQSTLPTKPCFSVVLEKKYTVSVYRRESPEAVRSAHTFLAVFPHEIEMARGMLASRIYYFFFIIPLNLSF